MKFFYNVVDHKSLAQPMARSPEQKRTQDSAQ